MINIRIPGIGGVCCRCGKVRSLKWMIHPVSQALIGICAKCQRTEKGARKGKKKA